MNAGAGYLEVGNSKKPRPLLVYEISKILCKTSHVKNKLVFNVFE